MNTLPINHSLLSGRFTVLRVDPDGEYSHVTSYTLLFTDGETKVDSVSGPTKEGGGGGSLVWVTYDLSSGEGPGPL